jgi:peptidoglycan-associated lipoprotein
MSQDPWSVAGCQNIESIHFGFDKFDINAHGREQAQHVAKCLEAHPTFTLLAAGNTDNRGTTGYNLLLGEKRALAVKHFLESKGIAASRIKTVSYGEQKPAMEGNNEEAWAKNRRVDFKLSN